MRCQRWGNLPVKHASIGVLLTEQRLRRIIALLDKLY